MVAMGPHRSTAAAPMAKRTKDPEDWLEVGLEVALRGRVRKIYDNRRKRVTLDVQGYPTRVCFDLIFGQSLLLVSQSRPGSRHDQQGAGLRCRHAGKRPKSETFGWKRRRTRRWPSDDWQWHLSESSPTGIATDWERCCGAMAKRRVGRREANPSRAVSSTTSRPNLAPATLCARCWIVSKPPAAARRWIPGSSRDPANRLSLGKSRPPSMRKRLMPFRGKPACRVKNC